MVSSRPPLTQKLYYQRPTNTIFQTRIQGWEDIFYQHVQFNKLFLGYQYNIGLSKCPKILIFNWSEETQDY